MPNINLPLLGAAAIGGLSYGFIMLPEVGVAATGGFSGSGAVAGSISFVPAPTATGGFSVSVIHQLSLAPRASAAGGFSVADSGVIVATTPTIRAVLLDVLALFGVGCCTNPSDCLLAEAVRAVNAGVQQFYLSDRGRAYLTNTQVQAYDHTALGTIVDLYGHGMRLPSAGATAPVSDDYEVQTIVKVVFANYNGVGQGNGQRHTLRPVRSSPLSDALEVGGAPGGSVAGWLDDVTDTGELPLFYEVFRDGGVPFIRIFPLPETTETWSVYVHYIPKAQTITALDFSNGASLPILAPYLETLLMPLCRHAALGSAYFDSTNAPQAAAVREKYAEALASLGLADIQQPEVAKSA